MNMYNECSLPTQVTVLRGWERYHFTEIFEEGPPPSYYFQVRSGKMIKFTLSKRIFRYHYLFWGLSVLIYSTEIKFNFLFFVIIIIILFFFRFVNKIIFEAAAQQKVDCSENCLSYCW